MLRVRLLQALPERVLGIMSNETLLAIPFFTFMGVILERSGMAEDLLDAMGSCSAGARRPRLCGDLRRRAARRRPPAWSRRR
jgi:TRAP-type mannitol/chloroaromatic compound transport system permease large subunit